MFPYGFANGHEQVLVDTAFLPRKRDVSESLGAGILCATRAIIWVILSAG